MAEDPPQIDLLSLLLGGVIGIVVSDIIYFVAFDEALIIPTAIDYMLGLHSSIRERFRRISAKVPAPPPKPPPKPPAKPPAEEKA